MSKGETECSIAPEICIEVRSDSNRDDELQEKRALYFESGALEVWICLNGRMSFFDPQGRIEHSRLAPDFPTQIQIEI